jgi:hypothetical protein
MRFQSIPRLRELNAPQENVATCWAVPHVGLVRPHDEGVGRNSWPSSGCAHRQPSRTHQEVREVKSQAEQYSVSEPGERRGGRQPGTPNKKTALMQAACKIIISFARGVAACSANCATGCSCRQSFDLTAPDLSQQCRPGPLPRLDLVLDPRFYGAERVESPATQLQAGELASLSRAGRGLHRIFHCFGIYLAEDFCLLVKRIHLLLHKLRLNFDDILEIPGLAEFLRERKVALTFCASHSSEVFYLDRCAMPMRVSASAPTPRFSSSLPRVTPRKGWHGFLKPSKIVLSLFRDLVGNLHRTCCQSLGGFFSFCHFCNSNAANRLGVSAGE